MRYRFHLLFALSMMLLVLPEAQAQNKPTLLVTTPTPSSIGMDPDAPIVLTFDRPVISSKAKGTFSLYQMRSKGKRKPRLKVVAKHSAAFSASQDELTIFVMSSAPLAENSQYLLKVSGLRGADRRRVKNIKLMFTTGSNGTFDTPTPTPSPTPTPTPGPTGTPTPTPTPTFTPPPPSGNCADGVTFSGGKIITRNDVIPDFGANPTFVARTSGNWSSQSTWVGGTVPALGAVVSIPSGVAVTYDVVSDVPLTTVSINGLLAFNPTINTRLTVQNLLVLPCGMLMIGSASAAVDGAVKAEVVFPNLALNTATDPDMYGNGLIALGTVTMHGAPRSASFVRLATEPSAGQTTLTLASAVSGWKAGDKIYIPDSKDFARETGPYVPEFEDATLQSVASNGLSVTLTAPLQFKHPGARNGDNVLEFLPHIGNRSRNVVIRSASSTGVRGHVFLTHRANVDIRYTQFSGLGRTTISTVDNTVVNSNGSVHLGTNQDERFPVHFAHLIGPETTPANGHQYTFIGNTVFCPMMDNRFKWGITINDSHYGLIQDNFLFNWGGAGLVTTTGSESYNVIERNFAAKGLGEGDRTGSGNPGNEGISFWFRGPNNYVRDNVGANYRGNAVEAAYGFKLYFVYLGDIHVPKFKGADMSVASQYVVLNGNATPLLEFARNEAYGVENGLSIWWLNAFDTVPQNGGVSTVKNFRTWHIAIYGFYGYPMSNVVFDGFTVRGNKDILSNGYEFRMGMWFGDYMTDRLVIRNADIQGMRTGIIDPYFGGSTSVIENSYLRNGTNIVVSTLKAPGSGPNGAGREPKSLQIRNVRFGSTAGWNLGGRAANNIAMDYTVDGSENLIKSDTVFVTDYNGVQGDNFQVFYNEQLSSFIVPMSNGNLVGSPEAGLTNQQNWNKYHIAIAGAVAPAGATTRSGIDGLVK